MRELENERVWVGLGWVWGLKFNPIGLEKGTQF